MRRLPAALLELTLAAHNAGEIDMRYEGSIVWQKSLQLAEAVILLSRALPPEERYGLRSQMVRAATSVPSNVAEGWVRESFKEKARFMSIAHGSLAELHTQILICQRARWLTAVDTRQALDVLDEIARMLTVIKRKWRSKSCHDAASTQLPRPDYAPPD